MCGRGCRLHRRLAGVPLHDATPPCSILSAMCNPRMVAELLEDVA